MEPLLEAIHCPLCNHDETQLLVESPDLLLAHPDEHVFRLVTCQHCGHIYQNPRPTIESIGHYYPPDYAPFQKAIDDEPSPWVRFNRRRWQHKICSAVHTYAGKPGRILDIGCATGLFLDGMKSLGWETVGVEPSDVAAQYARTRMGLNVFHGTLESAAFPDSSFDVVTLWDVFEHLHDPIATLAEIRRILRPDGKLVISIPNPDSFEAHFFKQHWLGWDLPRHLNLFRPLHLETRLRSLGIAVEHKRSFIYGYALFAMSLRQKLRGHPLAKVADLLLQAPTTRALAMLYYDGPANWYNLSSTIVLFSRKQS